MSLYQQKKTARFRLLPYFTHIAADPEEHEADSGADTRPRLRTSISRSVRLR